MRLKNSIKSIVSGALATVMTLSALPTINVQAAQVNEYIDPADVWITSNGRTNELDFNATITQETSYCPVCNKDTIMLTYRTPEYTKSGTTALNRGVMYSDGTMTDGVTKGNVDDGRPGIDAFYTTYHWTKSVCQVCGTINSADGTGDYSFGRNVYSLNSCDHDFFLDFDNTTYEPYNSEYHTTTLKKGQYCQFCKGTQAKATEQRERHHIDEIVDGEIGNQRFHITGECDDCGYNENEYVAAKSVVQSYYGKVDGKAHTVTVSDLSENGVHTSIRYGTEADKCNKTSAPNYTDEGYYPVYYEIDYSYNGESMTENGVSYVWLLNDSSDNDTARVSNVHVHDYRYIETVRPSCTELGYDRFQCSECGSLQKTNYVPATGHDYETIVIREPSCTQGGLEMHICKKCGSHYTENTSMVNHTYTSNVVASTCTQNGYTEHTCVNCGHRYITDLTPLKKHDYREKVTAPTCTTKGFTTYTCADCGDIYISDYVDPTGHEWDNGHIITNSTCSSEGVMEYNCKHCNEKMIQAISATGHKPGAPATCTEPQLCETCGAILEMPTGHHYHTNITLPTCTTMGFTTYTCEGCGDAYVGDYTDKTEHHYHSTVTPATCTELGYTTYTCTECGDEYKSDYVDKKPHSYKAVVTPATCTSMGYTTYTCEDCGDTYTADYTDVLPHNYTKKVIEPTCTEQGYTIYTCPDCGKEYIGDEKESTEHHYHSDVTAPTCTEMGFTTYTCEDCGYSYVADYTNPTGHHYDEAVTAPTCTEIGFTTFTCKDCGDHYVGNEQAKLPHDYKQTITAPTCTEMGYTVFECKDCGDSYTGDYKDAKGHSYKETVTAPTCTELGYSTFTCEDCGYTYKGSEVAKTEHKYKKTVTAPTCTELGYTTFVCEDCGDTHKGDYVEAAGHKPSGWIIDTAATIDNAGSKHIECTVCGEVLDSAEIPKLTKQDNSDEDGNSKVGDYSILITDKNNKPVFNSEISIDRNDNITIKLPDGRLLSAEDITTITVTDSRTQQAAKDIHIFIADSSNNAATGKTDDNGQLSVPNTQSSTGNSNGTVSDSKNTYVTVVTDKNGELIPNCTVIAGDNYSIDVKLPDGTVFNKDNRITVTVVTEKGEPVKKLRVQLIGDSDYIENGYTNIKGQLTLPMSNSDVTDENGNGEVGEIVDDVIYDYIVTVSDEKGLISDALVTLIAKDSSVLVCLPEGKVIDYFNRTTVKVVKSDGTPVENWNITVYNKDGSVIRTEVTDEDGIVIVPPLSEAPIAKPTPTPDPNAQATPLPGVVTTPKPDEPSETSAPTDKPSATEIPSVTDKPTVTPTNKPSTTEAPAATQTPIATDEPKASEAPNTTDAPTATETPAATDKPTATDDPSATATPVPTPPANPFDPEETPKPVAPIETPEPVSDTGDGTVVQNKNYKYHVYVWDNDGAITEFGLVKLLDNGNLEILLPTNKVLTVNNRIYVKVNNENDASPVEGISVKVTDVNGAEDTDITNNSGIAVVPAADSDVTNKYGTALVKDSDGNLYNVHVSTETKGNIEGAAVKIENGKIFIVLPDGTVIDYNDRTAVVVRDRSSKPVEGIDVNVKDAVGGDRTETTDENGKAVVPPINEGKTVDNGNTQVNDKKADYHVNVATQSKGNIPDADVVIKDGMIYVTLPDGIVIDYKDRVTVTVADGDYKYIEGISVNVKDGKDGNRTDKTDIYGRITVPPMSEDYTNSDGKAVVNGYTIVVEDTKAKIENAFVTIADGKISVKLPSTHELTTSNQTTVTVTGSDANAVKDMTVTVTDKNNATASKATDYNGKITVPVKQSSGGGGGGSRSSGGGGGGAVRTTYTVKVTDKDGKTVNVSKSITGDDITLTLPNGKTLDSRYYTVIVTDSTGKVKPNISVTLKDKTSSAEGTTDNEGKAVLPSSAHKAYVVGYDDGKFKPEGNMTRAEAAAIFARNIADIKGERISMTKSSFTDVDSKLWYSQYIGYLEKYDLIEGYNDGSFKPEEHITRAEFVTMCTRFYSFIGKMTEAKANKFTDVANKHWAYSYINNATAMDWIKGYADGTFRPDNNITRAEVVAIVNRVTDRKADSEYIKSNRSALIEFTDVKDASYWAYGDIIEAANEHQAVYNNSVEKWVK